MSIKVTKKSGIQQDGNIVQQLLFRYLPYWPLFVVMLILGVAAAYLYIRYAVPVYQANASILIKDEKKGVNDSKVVDQMNLFGSNKIVENEIEMIRSRGLLKNVVEKLYLYAPVYEEGKVNIVPAFTKSPVQLIVESPDSLISAEKIYFSFDKNKQIVTVEGKQFPLNKWVETNYGSPWKFVANPYYESWHVMKPMFFKLIEPKYVIDYLDEQLSVTPSSKQSTVINIKVKDPVPVRGKLVLNELIRQYSLESVKDKNELALNTLKYVEENLEERKRELDSVDKSIQEFRSAYNVVDISAQGQQYLAGSGVSDAELGKIDAQLSVLKQVENYVRSKGQGAAMVPSTMGLDPLLTTLLSQLYQAEGEYKKLITTTGENNPMAIQLKQQIEQLRPSILENIASQKSNLTSSRSSLASSGGKYNSLLKTIPEKERQYLEISRDRDILSAQYQELLKQKAETELSLSATVADNRVVDAAEASSEPVSPNVLFVYLISILSALGIAVLIIALKEGFNRTILFRSEIETYTNVPVIGEIIHDTSGQPIVISHDRKNFIAEQFRQIRTSLSYLGISSKKKKILITSSIPGEGKSFVAANLAISLALTDKKVVLLEVDLRKPKLSEIFGINSATTNGISNYLIGEREADEIIKRTEANPNLFIISAGPIPPNPSELILNGRIQELLVYLENAFDFIVIDTAPVSPVTDAYLLSQFCDSTLYVVRHAYTPRIYLQLLDENNRVRGLKNLALIFNGVKSRGIGKGGYGNGYGYGYGVGYDDVAHGDSKKSKLFGKVYR